MKPSGSARLRRGCGMTRPPTPALDAWTRREDARVTPGPRDALWVAACWEASAAELASDGMPRIAEACLARARDALRGAR